MQFEVDIIVWLQQVAGSGVTTFFNIMSWIGSYVGFVVLFVTFLVFNRKLAWTFGGCFVSGVVGNYILKHLIDRPRPFVSHPDQILNLTNTIGESMPSSHALCSVMLAIFLCYFVFKLTQKDWARLMAICGSIVIIVLTWISRMYLGMHYLTDLIVGGVIGLVISFIGIYFLEKKEKNVKRINAQRK